MQNEPGSQWAGEAMPHRRVPAKKIHITHNHKALWDARGQTLLFGFSIMTSQRQLDSYLGFICLLKSSGYTKLQGNYPWEWRLPVCQLTSLLLQCPPYVQEKTVYIC